MAHRRGNAHGGGELDSAGRATTVTDLQHERLTPDVWRQLHNQGKSNSEIALMFGKTPSAVSHMLSYYEIEVPKTKGQRMWPWNVVGDGRLHSAACQHLRRHSLWMTDGRKGMSAVRRTRLRNFYIMIWRDGLVIEYDPKLPPERGVSSAGGWTYRQRENADEDLIIRINKLIVPEIDDEFREFWSLPDTGEWPKLVGRHD